MLALGTGGYSVTELPLEPRGPVLLTTGRTEVTGPKAGRVGTDAITLGGQAGACPVPGWPRATTLPMSLAPGPRTSPSRAEPKAMKAPHSGNSHAWGPRRSGRVSGSHGETLLQNSLV